MKAKKTTTKKKSSTIRRKSTGGARKASGSRQVSQVSVEMPVGIRRTRSILGLIGATLLLTGGLLMGQKALAQNTTNSLNSLGNQSEIMQKARPSIPANTYRVVQKRVVERDYRSELGLTMGTVAGGGDSYYTTKSLGLQYDFHLSSRFSIGLRHQVHFNELSPEGKRVYDRAEAMANANNMNYVVPDLDQPLSTSLATISFYPLYGKVSWFESTVSYFDFYVMAGGGQMQLKNGTSPVGTGGVGMGLWWNQYLTSRIELRYQTYQDRIFTGQRQVEGAVASFTMGLLL